MTTRSPCPYGGSDRRPLQGLAGDEHPTPTLLDPPHRVSHGRRETTRSRHGGPTRLMKQMSTLYKNKVGRLISIKREVCLMWYLTNEGPPWSLSGPGGEKREETTTLEREMCLRAGPSWEPKSRNLTPFEKVSRDPVRKLSR